MIAVFQILGTTDWIIQELMMCDAYGTMIGIKILIKFDGRPSLPMALDLISEKNLNTFE